MRAKMRMVTVGLIVVIVISFGDVAQAAWLLWKHSLVTRRVEGAPRGLTPDGNVDKWELLNAVDLRKECISALRAEHKKSYESLQAAYPGEPISQTFLADGISGSVAAGTEKGGPKATQLYYEYTFWCLPAGVDPRSTRPASGKETK
ncbi:MAG TPA: hypothetical protein VNN13_07215 [Methylomirabilota bacterium]|nr:hypothetical protein [Methylomirabilota bacterium]